MPTGIFMCKHSFHKVNIQFDEEEPYMKAMSHEDFHLINLFIY